MNIEIEKHKSSKIVEENINYTRIHPYFQSENLILYLNDCIEAMSQLQDDSIDMIFADPPYLLSNDGVTCYAGKMVSVNKGDWDRSNGFDKDLMFQESWLKQAKRILKPEGTIWVSGTMHNIFQIGYLLQKLNYHILNDIVWYKPNAAPNLACTTFAHSHETLIWAKKNKKAKHIFNYEMMKNGTFPEDKMKTQNKQMRSVWSIPTPMPDEKLFGKHPTQKPLALLKRIVLASTRDNSIILDPFNGSGTTGLATLLIGNRQYIGIDNNKDYLDLTIKRFNHYNFNHQLFV